MTTVTSSPLRKITAPTLACTYALLLVASPGVVLANERNGGHTSGPSEDGPGAGGPGSYVIDTAKLEDADLAAAVERAVRRDSQPIFKLYRDLGHDLSRLSLDVKIRAMDGTSFAVDTSATAEGEAIGTKSARCEQCTERELVATITQCVADLLAAVDARRQDDPPRDDLGAGGTDAAHDEGPKPASRVPLSSTGKAGIALAAVGVVGLGVGIGLAVRADRPAGELGEIERSTTKPPGYAALGVGAAALVVGLVLLGIDRAGAKRRGSATANAPRRLHITPGHVPGGGALVLQGRF